METNLNLKRKWATEKSTIGELFFDEDSVRECYTLEDKVREAKIDGVTAIPIGRYEVVISYSNRFQRLLPLLVNVLNYTGVRIHSGNTDKDTEGCILVGSDKGENIILQSRFAMTQFMSKLISSMSQGKVFINISNEFESDTRETAT